MTKILKYVKLTFHYINNKCLIFKFQNFNWFYFPLASSVATLELKHVHHLVRACFSKYWYLPCLLNALEISKQKFLDKKDNVLYQLIDKIIYKNIFLTQICIHKLNTLFILLFHSWLTFSSTTLYALLLRYLWTYTSVILYLFMKIKLETYYLSFMTFFKIYN